MLRYTVVLVAGLVATASASAGTWADKMFDSLSKDFGSVPRGPTLEHNFHITNNTGRPVQISNVRVSCGVCSSAFAQKTYLNPGEETVIVAKMDTTRFVGHKNITVTVNFSAPGYDEVRLWMQANARDDFNLAPDALAFGPIKRGTAPTQKSTITFYGNGGMHVTEIRAESNYVVPVAKEVRRGGTEVVYELSAKLRADLPAGRWYTDVWLKTDNPAIPQVRVPLTVEVESPLSVSPDAVALGVLAKNAEGERKIIVKGSKPFKITGFEGADDSLTLSASSSEAKQVHVVTVKLKADKEGEFTRTVKLKTDMEEDGAIDITVSATVSP